MGPGSYLYRYHCKYTPTPQNRVQFSTPSYTGLVHTHTDTIVSIPQHPKTGYDSQHPTIRVRVHSYTDSIVSIPQHPKTGYDSQHPTIRVRVHSYTDSIVSIPQHPKTGYSSQHPTSWVRVHTYTDSIVSIYHNTPKQGTVLNTQLYGSGFIPIQIPL